MGEDFAELIPAFISSIESLFTELSTLGEDRDKKELMRLFDSIKSAANNVGAIRLSQIGSVLEQQASQFQALELDELSGILNQGIPNRQARVGKNRLTTICIAPVHSIRFGSRPSARMASALV